MAKAIVIASAIAGAGAIASSAIASSGAKEAAKTQAKAQEQAITAQQQAAAKEQEQRQSAADLQQQAIKENPYPTYLSTPAAQEYQKTLQERIAGKGLIDVNAATSPIAAQVREGLNKTNALTAAAGSARGLGRSTVTTAQLGQNSLAAEQDITSRMQQLELARQEQIGTAVNQYGDLSRTEAQSQANKVNYNVGNAQSQANTLIGNAAANTANQFDISRTIASEGATSAANQLTQANIWASAIQGLSQSAGRTATELIDKIDEINNTKGTQANKAMVNISGRAQRSAELLNPEIISRGGF